MTQSELEFLTDDNGSVAFGWVGPGVFYARFTGDLSAKLGSAYVTRLKSMLSTVQTVRYFADASALQSYDLLARSAFVRFVLANRRVFASMITLTWSAGIDAAARKYADTLGGFVDILTDAHDFDTRLLQAAPLARRKLDPKTWVRRALCDLVD
jgi:hypothetical protein